MTDAGLVHLENLKKLEKLTLGGPAITDRGVASLKKLSHVDRLYLLNTRVSKAGLADLKAALPKLTILR